MFRAARVVIPLVVLGFAVTANRGFDSPWAAQPSAAGQAAASRRLEVTVEEGTSMAIAVSPDRKTIVHDLQGSLWTMPAGGGTSKRITDELSDARQPSFSPDGKLIAYQAFTAGDYDIWTIAPDGSGAKKLTSGPYDDREPEWSHDGTRVAFASDRSGQYDIWQVDVKTGELKQLTNNPGNDFAPQWSRDDKEIAFVSDRLSGPGIYAVSLTGSERQLAQARGQIAGPAWTPDGDVLYNVVADDASQLIYKGKNIAPGENVFPFRARWISGTEFLYVADGKIKKRTLTGSSAQTIEFTAAFVFSKTPYTRKKRNFDSRDPRRVLGIVRPVISPDGTQVTFTALGDIWNMKIGAKPQRVTNDRFMDLDPSWSADGTKLLFTSDRAGSLDLWIRDLATGQDTRLTELPGAEMSGRLSPDGSQASFVSITGLLAGDIQVVDVKTKAVKKVHDVVFGPMIPAWSPDGRNLMYAQLKRYSGRYREGINEFVTFPVTGGADRGFVPTPHRSSDTRTGSGPAWAPDGKKIAFVMEGVLQVMDVTPAGAAAGAPRRLTTEIAHDPSWTGDSRRIMYLSNEKLRIVSVDGGAPQDVPLDLTYTPTIPSGRLVVHAGHFVDGKASASRANVDIVVQGNRITAIEPHRQDLHTGTVVDASSLTAMPGLIEMHGHLFKEYGEAMGRAFLSYGVTTVRNPAAFTPYMSIEDREAVEAGVRPGPRIFASGYQMDGSRIYYPLGLSITTPAQLEMQLEQARALDLDLIKTYVRLPDAMQKRVIEFAHGIGIPVTSHELYPAIALGADGTEHTTGTSRRGYSPKMTALNYTYQDVIRLMAQSGMAYTPTASLGGGYQLLTQKEPALLQDPRYLDLFPPWVTRPPAPGGGGGGGFGAPRELPLRRTGDILRNAQRGGVTILAGTDTPITPYGLSLQMELQTMVDYGGLTPLQAIQTATVNAAAALVASADLGSLEVGRLADIVLVDGDPLVNIANARNVRKVVKNGELHELNSLLGKGSN